MPTFAVCPHTLCVRSRIVRTFWINGSSTQTFGSP